MSANPRSQVLLAYHFSAAGFSPVFTCPAGYVTLVKSLYVRNNSGVQGNFAVFVRNAAQTVEMEFSDITEGTATTARWDGWIVLNPGDQLYAYNNASPAVVWVSGAILSGPPQFPAAGN